MKNKYKNLTFLGIILIQGILLVLTNIIYKISLNEQIDQHKKECQNQIQIICQDKCNDYNLLNN